MDARLIGERADMLISLGIGLWALSMGAQTKKTNPAKTVQLGKTLPLHQVYTVAGALVLLTTVVRLLAP